MSDYDMGFEEGVAMGRASTGQKYRKMVRALEARLAAMTAERDLEQSTRYIIIDKQQAEIERLNQRIEELTENLEASMKLAKTLGEQVQLVTEERDTEKIMNDAAAKALFERDQRIEGLEKAVDVLLSYAERHSPIGSKQQELRRIDAVRIGQAALEDTDE